MREINERGLWARQLRSRGSESPSGPCASWRTQQPSIGCEGDNVGPDAHGRSAESPRWAWAGGSRGGKRRSGLHLRFCKKCRISFQAGLQHVLQRRELGPESLDSCSVPRTAMSRHG